MTDDEVGPVTDNHVESSLARDRATLAFAIEHNYAQSYAMIFAVLGRWCHEGCALDSVRVGVCSCMVEHDGSVMGAMRALKVVAAHVIKAIDNGEEGC